MEGCQPGVYLRPMSCRVSAGDVPGSFVCAWEEEEEEELCDL